MGNKRRRRSRRRGSFKPDPIIATLASIAVFLVIVWAALYWNESSGRSLIVHADQPEAEASIGESPSPLSELEGDLPPTDSETSMDDEPAEGANEATDEQPEGEALNPAHESNGTTNNPDSTSNTADPESNDEPDSGLTVPTDSGSPIESEPDLPIESDQNSPDVSPVNSPDESPANSPISLTERYEQDIKEVQAACTKEMKEALNGAESSLEQLDRRDPVALQAWNEKWTNKLSEAESDCDGEFQEVIQNAEHDSVSPALIEEWKQTFIESKEELRKESKAKLTQLVGG
ncbi:hypothetical protein [Cohnella lupini]|uniref:Uncharacterized protein n=1 Tax=Cohnella lupini TaxID=1294267 RepID=A0A3D9HZC4_9BACL|nr:hypothetical protein [Cohnella lupini]RED54844.1 hypothetical protein DFP95_121101 [Cohnella lupini]